MPKIDGGSWNGIVKKTADTLASLAIKVVFERLRNRDVSHISFATRVVTIHTWIGIFISLLVMAYVIGRISKNDENMVETLYMLSFRWLCLIQEDCLKDTW